MGAGLWACPWEGRRLAGGRQVLEDYSVEGWAADDYDACERRADGRQALGFLQVSRGERSFVRSEARPGGPGNLETVFYSMNCTFMRPERGASHGLVTPLGSPHGLVIPLEEPPMGS